MASYGRITVNGARPSDATITEEIRMHGKAEAVGLRDEERTKSWQNPVETEKEREKKSRTRINGKIEKD